MAISKQFSAKLLDGHSLIGVIFGAIVYIVCLSGAAVVLIDQMTVWERPRAPAVERVERGQLAATIGEAYARAKAAKLDHDMFVTLPSPELPRMTIFARTDKGAHREWSVDAAGQLHGEVETPWVAFMQMLHFNLTVPGAIGRYLVGIVGTILLASIVTGVLAHRRIIKDAFRLRWGGAKRLANADLHNRVGVWALPFHLIVSLTGSLLGLSGLIIMILALVSFKGDQEKAIAALLGPQATEDSRPAPLPDLHRMFAVIDARTPGWRPVNISYEHVGTRGQQVQIFAAMPGYLTEAESWTFDGEGKLKAKAGLTDGNVGMRIYGMITPLHYGTYGGFALKLIYALLGTGLTLIVATGGNIWLARRRDQGRAAPRLEKLWAGVLWGQPIILLGLAMLCIVWPEAPATGFYWAMTLAVPLLALRAGSMAVATRWLRIAIGVSMPALGVLHSVMQGWAAIDALTIDVVLIGGGLWMLAAMMGPSFWSRRSEAGTVVLPAE